MDWGTLFLFVSIAVLIFWVFDQYFDPRKKDLPPMPLKVPFFGHLLFMDPKRPFITVTQWGQKLGTGVYRIFFGPDELYVLNDYETIKEALVKQGDNFVGRPNVWLFDVASDRKGVILADGPRWKEQRRFSLSRLRDFGLGKSIISDKIQVEIDKMLEEIKKERDTESVLNLIHETRYCVANIINSIIYDFTFPKGDPEFETFQQNMSESMRIIGLAGFLMAFPFLRYIIPGGMGFWRLMESKNRIYAFHRRQIHQHAKDLGKPLEENDDFATAYLKETKSKKEGEAHYFDEDQLLHVLGDLFFAGQETTVTTLKWAFLFLIYNPEVQEKMVKEMREKVGRQPTLDDRNLLTYCHAVTMEAQRLGNIIPFGVWHSNLYDTTINGYRIPAGSTILPNMWAAMMDAKLFPEPEKFKPERFLNADGSVKQGIEGFIPFSMGKRLCLGESLARAELFMILTAVTWNFRIAPDPNNPQPSLEPVLGTTVATQDYRLKLTEREKI